MKMSREVERILDENDWDYSQGAGCFDIVARKKELMLLKLLDNIDSFQEEQSRNLLAMSSALDANAFVIGSHTRRENLMDNVIYDRFGTFAMTTTTLQSMMESDMP